MEPVQIALFISFISLIVASISLYWSIKREFLKPKVKVDFRLYQEFSGKTLSKQQLIISGTNMGPGEVQLTGVHLKPKWAWLKKIFNKRLFFGFIFKFDWHYLNTRLPSVVKVGERKDFYLIYNKDCFLKEDKFVSIGFLDSFEKWHWVSKKQYKKVQEQFKKESW